MLALALVALLPSLAYQDIHQRFTVDLPNEWQLAPMPGDTGGVTFRRTREGVLAICSIRITNLKRMSLDTYVKKLIASNENEKGYRALIQEPDTLAGAPAYRRRFALDVDQEGKIKKTVEERIAIANGIGYIIHVETLEGAFDSFVADFQHFIDTFKPAGSEQPTSAQPSMGRFPVVGIWRMEGDANTVLALNPNGTLTMSGFTGLYRVEGGKLVVQLTGGIQEVFTWNLVGDTLTLVSPTLGEPIRYKRQR